jgi:hypothetical protein
MKSAKEGIWAIEHYVFSLRSNFDLHTIGLIVIHRAQYNLANRIKPRGRFCAVIKTPYQKESMNAPTSNPKKVNFVGEGLEKRTYEDCLELHLNPNGNAAGEILLPAGSEEMREHIRQSQDWSLKALAK